MIVGKTAQYSPGTHAASATSGTGSAAVAHGGHRGASSADVAGLEGLGLVGFVGVDGVVVGCAAIVASSVAAEQPLAIAMATASPAIARLLFARPRRRKSSR